MGDSLETISKNRTLEKKAALLTRIEQEYERAVEQKVFELVDKIKESISQQSEDCLLSVTDE